MPHTIATIHPTAVYSNDDLSSLIDVSPDALAKARRSGALRWVRKGRRVIYLGEWVLDWLRAGGEEAKRA
jgi:hypothetical protein